MPVQGFDCVFDASDFIPQIKDGGYEFVCRYYFRASKYKTLLTRSEVVALNKAGVSVVTVYEGSVEEPLGGASAGSIAALAAMGRAMVIGQPDGSPIYFAVDFDASNEQIENGIDPYFRAIIKAFGGKYKIGAYGSGLVLSTLDARKLITHQWLAGAMGWRMSRGYAGAQIIQAPAKNLGFGDVDPNIAQGDYGGWRLDADRSPQPASVLDKQEAGPRVDPIKTAIGSLQAALNDGKFDAGIVDGICGAQTIRAIQAYNRNLPQK